MEEWKDVVGYEGLYKVSNKGNVLSCNYYRNSKPHLMKPQKNSNGYLKVVLSKNKKSKQFTIHRLVALAFLPNPDNLEMVNHKDENPENNNIENLEWCSRSYNQVYSMNLHEDRRMVFGNNFRDKKTGQNLSPYTKKGVPHTEKRKVRMSTYEGNEIRIFNNCSEAAVFVNNNVSNIIGACRRNARTDRVRKRKQKSGAYGYVWEFIEN